MTDLSLPAAHRAALAFVDEVGVQGWASATLDGAALRAGMTLADLVAAGGDRWSLLGHFGRAIDQAAIREAEADGGSQAVRDRLFGLLMARLDALTPHREGIAALARAARTDPGLAAFFACRLPRAIGLLAEVAGVRTTGLAGQARVRALSALYLSVVRTWLDDDSEDLGPTMKALDAALARAERWAGRFDMPFAKRASPVPPAPTSQSSPDTGPEPQFM